MKNKNDRMAVITEALSRHEKDGKEKKLWGRTEKKGDAKWYSHMSAVVIP